MTALMVVSEINNSEISHLLLDKGANALAVAKVHLLA